MIDPLEIINEFMIWSPSTTGKPCPIDLLEENRAWLTRLCALAERCAQAENTSSELEEQAKLYTALKDPQSVDAFTAIQLYIQRHFDAEKRERLFRLCGSMNYVEMSNRIKELEDIIASFDPIE